MKKDTGQGSIIEAKHFPHSRIKFWPLSSRRNPNFLKKIHLFLENLNEETHTQKNFALYFLLNLSLLFVNYCILSA